MMNHFVSQTMNQSMNQSINQSLNQPVNQSVNQQAHDLTEPRLYLYKLDLGGRPWTLIATGRGICRISFQHETEETLRDWAAKTVPGAEIRQDKGPFAEWGAVERMERYFAGQPETFAGIPLDVRGTAFQREVWLALGRIPYGEMISYKELAALVGRPQAMRAVGAANGKNPLPIILPCHRVIGTNGTLTGYRGGLVLKQELLELEGITRFTVKGHDRFAF
ncbi:methylated-DNA--[protein]-cysteine S-methyltransferase [Paenibacillus sp. CN-4]|uniref:methylated-DNA--[protein]-cysteine S-methyltransferase n=1 Tax=Paenibacillus nanchangensis TaxID=3348343 RepID=UPI0039787892